MNWSVEGTTLPITIACQDESAEDLRRVARSCKNVAQARWLLAIALVAEGHRRTEAASAVEMHERVQFLPARHGEPVVAGGERHLDDLSAVERHRAPIP